MELDIYAEPSWIQRAHSRYPFNGNTDLYPFPEEIGLASQSIESLYEIASKFSAIHTLPVLSQLSNGFQVASIDHKQITAHILNNYFSQEDQKIFFNSGFSNSTPITPLHLRLLIWLILRVGSRDEGYTLESEFARFKIGNALLNTIRCLTPDFGIVEEGSDLATCAVEQGIIFRSYRMSYRPFEDFEAKGFVLKSLLSNEEIKNRLADQLGFNPIELITGFSGTWAHFFTKTLSPTGNPPLPFIDFHYLMGKLSVSKKAAQFYRRKNHKSSRSPGTSKTTCARKFGRVS